MESALQLVLRHAAEQRAQHVERVVLRIGTLSGVEPQALRFAFAALTPGTPVAGAALDIEPVSAVAYCASCSREFEALDASAIFQCPGCGAFCGELRHGRELELTRIEMS